MTDKLSRRELLPTLGALAVFGASACSKSAPPPLNCSDTTGLASADVSLRTTLGYVDVSTQPGKTCTGCSQFKPGPANACGGCAILKGLINPGGYCKSFTAKTS
jgi:hypothetical protein